jgi:hypothetical protein
MLHSVKVVNDEWRILVVDDVTVKVFSAACKLSDVTEENVSRACPGPRRAPAARRHRAAPSLCSARRSRASPARAVVEDLSKRREPMPGMSGAPPRGSAARTAPACRCLF